ncbi:TPA: hypothetical protein ACXKGF_005232 [Escherichia coli]
MNFSGRSKMFVHFISRKGKNLLVNIKDVSFVVQKGIFCEVFIRGIEGYVVVSDNFDEISKKIESFSFHANEAEYINKKSI